MLLQVIDRRDLETGLTAMNRTVGFTASIGAQMLGVGSIAKRGLLSPMTDVPYGLFAEEMQKRGISLQQRTTAGLAKGGVEGKCHSAEPAYD